MQSLLDNLAAYRRYLGTYLEDAALYWRGFSRFITGRWWLRIPLIGMTLSALLLVALHPLMFGTLPESPDGLLHLYRLVALDHAVSEGNIWPRYAPGLAFGYGVPIFNFYAPLYLYPFELLHQLGLSFVDSLLVGLGILTVVGALGAFLMGRMWVQRDPTTSLIAGLVAAVAYAYAPYTFYNMPRRMAIAEFVALAVLPWVAWAFWRLSERPTRWRFIVAVILYLLFIPLHNITTIAGTLLLVALCLHVWQRQRRQEKSFAYHTLIQLSLAGISAIALTCFFWLPALAETDYAQINAATENVGDIQVENNFHTLADTFALPRPADLTEIHPPVPRPVGWPQVLLGITAIGVVLYQGRWSGQLWQERRWMLLSVGLALAFIVLTLPISGVVYRYVPLLGYTQFPWRMLGPASLMLAMLASAGGVAINTLVRSVWGKALWTTAILAGLVLYGLPWLYGVYIPRPQADTIVDAQNFERATGWVGTASFNEYLPRWTQELPPTNQLTGLYAETERIPRLQPVDANVEIRRDAWGLASGAFIVETDTPTTLTFNWLYFPGFWASIDGERVPVRIVPPSGTFALDVPAGESTIVIGFGPTPLRFWSMVISGITVIALFGLMFVKPLWLPQAKPEPIRYEDEETFTAVLLLALLAGGTLFGAKLLYFDSSNTLIKRERFSEGVAAGLDVPVEATFEGQVRLLGYSGLRSTASGGSLDLTLYWQLAEGTIEQSYASIIFISDAEGNIISLTGHQHAGDWPIWAWLPGFYVEERLTLDIPPATPPGSYELHAALYDTAAMRNLDVTNVDGIPAGVSIQMDTIILQRPTTQPTFTELGLDDTLGESLIGGIALLDASDLPASIEVGQPFTIEWLLQSASRFDQAYTARILWLAEDEVIAISQSLEPSTGYPATEWRRGDIWRGIHVVTVPGDLPAGAYDVALQLANDEEQLIGEAVRLTQMEITTPERSFTLPQTPQTTANVTWNNGIELLGYDLVSDLVPRGNGVQLTFYWQPNDQVDRSLTMFVHLLDLQGNLVAQQDTIPVNGTRPTTGWVAGEILTDDIAIFIRDDIPPGEYRLSTGWYDATTGERVKLSEDDFWLLPASIQVVP